MQTAVLHAFQTDPPLPAPPSLLEALARGLKRVQTRAAVLTLSLTLQCLLNTANTKKKTPSSSAESGGSDARLALPGL